MRILAVYETNTNHQKNPFFIQDAADASVGKSASLTSFEECLRAQYQNDKPPAKAYKSKEKGLVYTPPGGANIPRGGANGSEIMLMTRAYLPLSEFSTT